MNKCSDSLKEWEELTKIVALLKTTPFMKKFGEEGLWNVVLAAKSCKVDIYRALREMNVVRGKVEMSVHFMSSLIRSQGHSIQKSPDSTPKCCKLVGKRADNGDSWEASFSLENAMSAGLINSSPTWKAYPERMLFARALSILSRELFSDVIGGMYVEGEISDSLTMDKKKTFTSSVKWVEDPEEYLDENQRVYLFAFVYNFGYSCLRVSVSNQSPCLYVELKSVSMKQAAEVSSKTKVSVKEMILQGKTLYEDMITHPIYQSKENRFFLWNKRQWAIKQPIYREVAGITYNHFLGESDDPTNFLSLRESMEVWYYLEKHQLSDGFREVLQKARINPYHLPRKSVEKVMKACDITLEAMFAINDRNALKEATERGEDV